MCYGALNLLVRLDASNFVPYACDRAVAGEYEGPESTAPSSAISGGSVAAKTVVPYFGDSLTCVLVPSFFPQEKKSARCCRFESLSDSGFIAQNMAFYRPYKARTDISLANKRTT